MPRLDMLQLTIKVGERGLESKPRYAINGIELDFDEVKGGSGPHETLELTGKPGRFLRSMALIGPDEGYWDIKEIRATYDVATADYDASGSGPYTLRLGAVTLDAETKLNLWYERPPQLLEV